MLHFRLGWQKGSLVGLSLKDCRDKWRSPRWCLQVVRHCVSRYFPQVSAELSGTDILIPGLKCSSRRWRLNGDDEAMVLVATVVTTTMTATTGVAMVIVMTLMVFLILLMTTAVVMVATMISVVLFLGSGGGHDRR